MKEEIIIPRDPTEFRYLDLSKKLELDHKRTDFKKKFIAKCKANPFVPIGDYDFQIFNSLNVFIFRNYLLEWQISCQFQNVFKKLFDNLMILDNYLLCR